KGAKERARFSLGFVGDEEFFVRISGAREGFVEALVPFRTIPGGASVRYLREQGSFLTFQRCAYAVLGTRATPPTRGPLLRCRMPHRLCPGSASCLESRRFPGRGLLVSFVALPCRRRRPPRPAALAVDAGQRPR